MDEYTIRQAIDLIKAKRLTDARKLLRPVLEVNPENEAAWIWFSSTFLRVAEQLEVLEYARGFCPESQPIKRGIQRLEADLADKNKRGEEVEPTDISHFLPVLQVRRESPSEMPAARMTFSWETPLKENSYTDPALSPEAAEADWINSLRNAAATETDETEDSDSMAKVEFDSSPTSAFWEPEIQEVEEEPIPPPAPPVQHAPELIPSIPQARQVLWNGQEIGQESVETSPFFSDMTMQPEERFTVVKPKKQRVEDIDPYRIPLYFAITIGILLFMLVVIFLIVIGLVNFK
jgi:hypothetical protein